MKIGFYSLVSASVTAELQRLVRGQIQKIIQIDDNTVVFGIYNFQEEWLLISCDSQYCRAHLIARRPEGLKPAPDFCQQLRRVLLDGKIAFIRQRGLDRILEIGIETPAGPVILVAELTGRHANLMAVGGDKRILAVCRPEGSSKTARPVTIGLPYLPPPHEVQPLLTTAVEGDELREYEGWSPTLQRFMEAGFGLADVKTAFTEPKPAAWFKPGEGAYPLPWFGALQRESISTALELHFAEQVEQDRLQKAKSGLRTQLTRVLKARREAVSSLEEALDRASRAGQMQQEGDLILAYQGQIKTGDTTLKAWDFEGNEVEIVLNPELTALENAQTRFDKAKKAKNRAADAEEQKNRLADDALLLAAQLSKLEEAKSLDSVEDVRAFAESKKWLHRLGPALAKEERPFEGFQIREALSPADWRVLYGMTSTANDYLTTKVAKPNDWWLHVRGGASTHVIIQTNNQPDRVQKADLMFAAEIAVKQSAAKHSGFVQVDYTLKKYVRKPRKSAPGFATYTMEKTLSVERLS